MIRKADERDASVLAAVSMEVWLNTYLREGLTPLFADYALSEFTTRKFRGIINDPNHAIWVSECATGIDGFVLASSVAKPPLETCSSLEIMTLYVRPRQQTLGRGTILLRRALQHFRANGGESAWLKVNAENSRAIAFYHRHHFNNVGSTYFEISNQAFENFVMKIDLSQSADFYAP